MATGQTLFTATDLHTWIIRDITIANTMASGTLKAQIWIKAGSTEWTLFYGDVAAGSSTHLELRQEILPSEELHAGATNGPVSIVVTGYALTPP